MMPHFLQMCYDDEDDADADADGGAIDMYSTAETAASHS